MRPFRNFLLLLTIILGIQGLAHAQTSDEKRLSITKDVMDDFRPWRARVRSRAVQR